MHCYCPRCRRDDFDRETICPRCGEGLIPEGYCGVCETFWPLPAGASCPKHEIELEPGGPSPAQRLADQAGAATRWTTVGTFADDSQAEALRIRLEAEGIPTILEGARMGSRSMYTVATGGVKLQVPEPLAADARVLLAQSWTPPDDDLDLDDAWDDLAPEPWTTRRKVMKLVILFLLTAPFTMLVIAFLIELASGLLR